MKLNDMKVGTRLWLGFGVMILFLLAGAGFAYKAMTDVNTAMDDSMVEARQIQTILDVRQDVGDVYFNLAALVMHKEAEEKREHKALIEKHRQAYRPQLEQLRRDEEHPEGQRLLAAIDAALSSSADTNNRAVELSTGGKDAEAQALFSEAGAENLSRVDKAFQDFIDYQQRTIKSMDDATEALHASYRMMLIVGGLVSVLIAVFFAVTISGSVTKPIAAGLAQLEQVAKGDVSKDVPQDLQTRKDEIGDLGRSMQSMTLSLRRLLKDVGEGVQTLASSSTELSAVATQTAAGTRTMGDKATTVAAAAEEASANTRSVASSMEGAAHSLTSVASATEEMSATIGEVAQNAARARNISEQASEQAQSVSAMIRDLGNAAHEIGKVTETITDISSQTNLLALNATIEAARAGAAGKGFAVVANEIKELARQTATATEDIKAKIGAVQNSTGSAISDVQKITEVVHEVGSLVNSIAAAIEEQAAVTRDVAGNIANATSDVKESNDRVSQTASVSQSIAHDVASLNVAMTEIKHGGEQVQSSAAELSKLAERLRAIVGQFRT